MNRLPVICVATLIALVSPLAVWAQKNIDSTNEAIRVSANQSTGNVTTVNGSVTLEAGAKVTAIQTTNGAVELGDKAQVRQITTANAGVSLGSGSVVEGSVSTTNGSVVLSPGAVVQGQVNTIHGSIELNAAHVAGGIHTTSANITIGANSRVEGGISVGKQESFLQWGHPTVIIGPHAIVQGPLEFRQEVDLRVSESAKIGHVTGAEPRMFEGDAPEAAH
ncbi:DUF4097 domain-containing protein [Rhodanobacter lindaniclasticus]|uniref:Adhesin n=1 Tax=Rhodanobacter lindaniclasticus TaxID=75310 RepID=A0A4S3KN50_9GAMM|nr:DUF4097 domain-containing protein [Rhodanobacter lindaniclasticus]THD10269.1 hypothetical protein B1991_00005 [Rhodanobacter lindaniclasticus]